MSAVNMEVTGFRSRKFTGSIEINADVDDVWAVITDYDRAATILPTLTASRRLPAPAGTILVEQESRAPPLPGLDQRQFTTARMVERIDSPLRRTLEGSLSEDGSKMFEAVNSKTMLSEISPGRTKLAYKFDFTLKKRQLLFKGPQLMLLTEQKVKQETPNNLQSVKKAAEGTLAGYTLKKPSETP